MRNNSESNSVTCVASRKSVTCVVVDNTEQNATKAPVRLTCVVVDNTEQNATKVPVRLNCFVVDSHLSLVGIVAFDADQEDAALVHLKEHLSWRLQRGRDT
jgi:hypothetical protein